jgi:hypothetical protein
MFSHAVADTIRDRIEKWKVDPIIVAPIIVLLLIFFALGWDRNAIIGVLVGITLLSPVWLPVFLFVGFWKIWMHYIRFQFWFNQENVLLEIQLPAEVEKSPLAMELFLTALWNSGNETTFIKRIWEGSFRPIWSLEIASNEGRIGYYIRAGKSWKNIIESRLYGQFPEAKVTEVDDYTNLVPFNLEEYDLWGSEYKKMSPLLPDAVPIKTYIDYKLDKDPDEEFKIDPMTNILELLGTMGPGEHYWMQIILKARKKDEWYGFYKNTDHYRYAATEEIHNIMRGASERAKSLVGEDEVIQAQAAARGISLLTDAEKRKIEEIERSLSKLLFECGIRVIYVAKKERYNSVNIPSTVRFFDAFRSLEFNAINIARGLGIFDYPWQDFHNIRRTKIKKQLWFRYRHRAYFYVPYDQDPVFMTTEELATIWHFPSSIVKTPSLQRVPSKRAEAPINLPTLPS